MAYTVDLSSLTKYTDELSQSLVRESVLKGKTAQMISLVQGVKYKESLNLLSSTLNAKAGGCGAFSATGSVALTQRDIEVCDLKVEESYCLNDFEQYWIGQFMKDGSYNESAPANFNEIYVADKVAKLQALVEDYFWKGSTTGTYSSTFTLCNGVLHAIDASGAAVTGSTFSGTPTTANILTIVDDMVSNIPSAVLEDDKLTLFMSYREFNTYTRALRATYGLDATGVFLNTGSYNQAGSYMAIHPGTNVLIVATRGLNSLSGPNAATMILTPAWNLVMGTDLLNDTEKFQVWYDMVDDDVKFRAKWKLGAQVYFPAYVVKYR